jgi:glutamate-ammonia-ligase adenylyltransferase
MTGSPARDVGHQIDAAKHAAAGKAAVLPETDARALLSAYTLFWQLHAAARLLTPDTLDVATLGQGAQGFVLRETGQSDVPALAAALAQAVQSATQAVARLVGDGEDGETGDGSRRS